jgi:hypothetical protein
MRAHNQSAKNNRAAVIHRFVLKERARSRMRFFELSSLAGIYANDRCNGDVDAAYRKLIKAIDDIGFLGSRILYLGPDVGPPYFSEPLTSPEVPLVPKPHKQNPLITRKFIEAREHELGWIIVRDNYLAKSWVQSLYAARWLQSKGIAAPGSISWSLDSRDEKMPTPIVKKLIKPIPKSGAKRAARLALDALYPKGVPNDKTGQELTNSVNRYFERHRSDLIEGRVNQAVSLDTVLRAAERKQ